MSEKEVGPEPTPRSEVLRDVLVFQVKLWVEGFKDVVLIPLSLGAALVDLLVRRRGGRGVLYAVMRLGDRFERWVDLYAPLDDGPAPRLDRPPPSAPHWGREEGESETDDSAAQ